MSKFWKWFCGTVIVLVVLLMGAGWWLNSQDTVPVVSIPTPTMPAPNAYDFFVKAGQEHSKLRAATPNSGAVDPVTDTKSSSDLSPQQLAQRYPTAAKEKWIKANAGPLQLLRQGFNYEYLHPPVRSSDSKATPYADFRWLARLLIIESRARAERGDWAGASRSCLDLMRFGYTVPRGGPLIPGLVGCALNAIGRNQFHTLVPHLDAATARKAATEIESLEARRFTFSEIMQEEKFSGQAMLLSILKQTNTRAINPIGQIARLILKVPTKRQIMENYTGYMDALIAQGQQPYLAQKPIPMPTDPVNKTLLPVFDRARFNIARNETGSRLLLLKLALHAHKLERGQYPATLQELIPSYIKAVPLDPFGGGEALRYRRTGNSYLLYSIGPDGKDDGGKPIVDPTYTKPSARHLIKDESTGDAVSGVNDN